jgi:hypothetical protein
VAERDANRQRIMGQARRAAEALAEGRPDAAMLAPPEIRSELVHWQERVQRSGRRLDLERWFLGLLTLMCLPRLGEAGVAARAGK